MKNKFSKLREKILLFSAWLLASLNGAAQPRRGNSFLLAFPIVEAARSARPPQQAKGLLRPRNEASRGLQGLEASKASGLNLRPPRPQQASGLRGLDRGLVHYARPHARPEASRGLEYTREA